MLRRFAQISVFSMVVAVAGCLDSSGPGQAIDIEDTNFASSLNVDLNASTKTVNGMYYRDLTVGTGPVVANGQTLDVRYTGWLSSGYQFETNVGDALPFPFTLGVGDVIVGWDEGLQGARVGTRRQLIIPAYLAYGPGGNGPIPGNAVTVFVVEIVAAR